MANFDKNSEAVLNLAQERAAAARKMNLSAANLETSANASFRFEENDELIISPQLAEISPLSGEALKTAKANDRAEGFFVFNAVVKRGKKEISCRVSARQLYTPTVWTKAETLDGVELKDEHDNPVELFCAPRSEAKKRFGEWGAPQTIEGIPFIDKEIRVKLTIAGQVYLSKYLVNEEDRNAVPAQQTALIKRENYAIALD